MHTVELLPDAALEHGVRDMWERLAAAGLPSLATHRHPTNRPHLTVLTAASLDALPPLPLLPLEAELGPVRMLGRALVLEVTRTTELRDLHAALYAALPDPWPPPGDFIPHVSLALKVPPDRREAALDFCATYAPARGHFVTARSYDTETRTVTPVDW